MDAMFRAKKIAFLFLFALYHAGALPTVSPDVHALVRNTNQRESSFAVHYFKTPEA
jgi:hypothetical protein